MGTVNPSLFSLPLFIHQSSDIIPSEGGLPYHIYLIKPTLVNRLGPLHLPQSNRVHLLSLVRLPAGKGRVAGVSLYTLFIMSSIQFLIYYFNRNDLT